MGISTVLNCQWFPGRSEVKIHAWRRKHIAAENGYDSPGTIPFGKNMMEGR